MDAATAAPKTKIASTEGPQHLMALERANSVRLARAELKRGVARGEIDAADVVARCPWEAATMTVGELLTSQRRWGRTRARKFLTPLVIGENRQLEALTERQRRLIALQLASRRPGDPGRGARTSSRTGTGVASAGTAGQVPGEARPDAGRR